MIRLRDIAIELVNCAVSLALLIFAIDGILHIENYFELNNPVENYHLNTAEGVTIYRGAPWVKKEFSQIIRKNAEGFHASSFASCPECRHRIAVVGDSFIEALQVEIDSTFPEQAHRIAPSLQFLALGRSGNYSPIQLAFSEYYFPQYFGVQGKYPPLDAVIFCFEQAGPQLYFSEGLRTSDTPPLALPEQFLLKKYVFEKTGLPAFFSRHIVAPSAALSFLSSQISAFLAADLRRTTVKESVERRKQAVEVLLTKVVHPMIQFAEREGLVVGFLYVPRVDEINEYVTTRASDTWRYLVVQGLSQQGNHIVDATPYFINQTEEDFFKGDGHPRASGHLKLARALIDLSTSILPKDP